MPNDFQVKFGADTSDLNAGLDQLNSKVTEVADRLQGQMVESSSAAASSMTHLAETTRESGASISESINGALESVKRLAETFLIFEGLDWAKETIKGALETGERLKNMSLEIGVSTQHLQEMQFAAAATGSDFSRLTQFAGQLTRAFVTLSSGTTSRNYTAVLGAAGLKASDLTDTYTALEKISDAIHRLGENSVQARALLVTFGGRGGLALAPMLDKFHELSDEAERLGLVLNTQTLEALDSTNEKFNELGFIVKVDEEKIAAALTPVLETLVKLLTQVALHIGELVQNGKLQEWALSAADGLIDIVEAVYRIIDAVEAWGTSLEKLKGFWDQLHGHFITGMNEVAEATRAQVLDAAGKATNAHIAALEAFKAATHARFASPLGSAAAPEEAPTPASATGFGAAPKTAAQIASAAAAAAKLEQSQIELAAKGAEDRLAIQRAGIQQRLALGQEGAAEAAQQEQALADRVYAIQKAALERENALAGLKPAQHQAIVAKLQELDARYQETAIASATKIAEAQRKTEDSRLAAATAAQLGQVKIAEALSNQSFALSPEAGTPENRAAELQAQQAFATESYSIERNRITQEMQGLAEESAGYQKLYGELTKLDDDWAVKSIESSTKIAEAHQKAADDAQKAWSNQVAPAFDQLTNAIGTAISGTKTLNESFLELARTLALSAIKGGITDFLTGGSAGSVGAAAFGERGKGGGLTGLLGSAANGIFGMLFGPSSAVNIGQQMVTQASAGAGNKGGILGLLLGDVTSFLGVSGGAGAAGGTSAAGGAATGAAGATGATGAIGGAISGASTFAGLATGFNSVLTTMQTSAASWVARVLTTLGGLVPGFTSMVKGIESLFSTIAPAATSAAAASVAQAKLSVATAAGESGAWGFESVMAALPFPINVAVAPGIAAQAFAQTLAFGAFERGGITAGGLAMLHPREMVLPANLADHIQRTAAGMGARGDGDSNGSITISPTYHVNAMDSRGVEAVLRQHRDALVDLVHEGVMRRGGRYRLK